MTPDPMPLAELTRRAVAILTRELGPAETLRFLDQFGTGRGDYTAERDQLLAGLTLDQVVADITRRKQG